MNKSSSYLSFPKNPDSPLPISRSCLDLQSLSSALPPPSSSFPKAEPTPASLDVHDSDVESDETLWDLYERWMIHCEVCRSLDEKQQRFVAFKENVKYIHSENKTDNFPYKLELNKYSDMTIEEFESKRTPAWIGGFKHLNIRDSDVMSDKAVWRLYKLWMTRYNLSRSPNEKLKRFVAFKENVKYIHSENKKDNIMYKVGLNLFSDMTREEFERKYLGGGTPAKLLNFYGKIMEKGGILSDEDYRQGKMDGPKLTFDGYRMVPRNDEEALEEEIRKHPVIALVDARGDAFKNYRGGVLTEEFGKEPVRTVTIDGYGVTPNGVKYWEIHNCWGRQWGENGYMRIKRGVNLCGITSFVSIPILNDSSVKAYCSRGYQRMKCPTNVLDGESSKSSS